MVMQPGNRPLPPLGPPRGPAWPADLQALHDALQADRPGVALQRTLAAAVLLLMDPAASLHPTLHDMLEGALNHHLSRGGAAHLLPFGADSFEKFLANLSPLQRAALWSAPQLGVDDPLRALWQQWCLHGQGLLIQQARQRLLDDAISDPVRVRLHDLIPFNSGSADEVVARTAGAEAALHGIARQCSEALESLQRLDRSLHVREWTQALPAALATQAANHALAGLLPSAALFRLLAALPGLYQGPHILCSPGTPLARATTVSEALAAVNGVLEKVLLAPALLHAAAATAAAPINAASMLLIGAVACGVQDAVGTRLLQHTGIPRLEAGTCIVEWQRLRANGSSAWHAVQAAAAPWRSDVPGVLDTPGGVDAARAQIDAIDDIHRLFQGSLLDRERRVGAQQRHQERLQSIIASLRGADTGSAAILRQERARLETGLSLLERLPAAPDALLRILDTLHDVRGQLASATSPAARGVWPGGWLAWLPACLLGVRNVLPQTLQETSASPFIPPRAMATVPASTTRAQVACGAIRRNPMIALGVATTTIVTGLFGRHLLAGSMPLRDPSGEGGQPAAGVAIALPQAHVSGPHPLQDVAVNATRPLCIGIYLHDDLMPTDTRMEEIHEKYFSWLLRDLKSVFPATHIQFHYMKRVPGITDMAYRTWLDHGASLATFHQKAAEHRLGGAFPAPYVQKYLLMTEAAPSLVAIGVAMEHAAIASNTLYVVPAHEIGHMLDATHANARVHYNGWWCETNMGQGALNLLRTGCYVFSEENRERMRAHQKRWRNSPLF